MALISRQQSPHEYWGEVEYPDSDGLPLGNNEIHLAWIRFLLEALEGHFRDRQDVAIFGDLFWYPVKGQPEICVAPDVMVVFGRGRGKRGSYRPWEEEGIVPQVVFEIISPFNTASEMLQKHRFFEVHGAEEYYIYDCTGHTLNGYVRRDGQLMPVPSMIGWISPRLGLGLELDLEGGLRLFTPDGRVLGGYQQLMTAMDRERAEKEKFATKLKELGIDPDSL